MLNWWSHRSAGARRPILLVWGDVGHPQVCRDCGVVVLDPKNERRRKDQCSRCQMERSQEYWEAERAKGRHQTRVLQKLEPMKCICGFPLPKCEAHHCHPKKDVPQRKLFD